MIDEKNYGMTRKEREERSPVWDMSQERVFIETIANQRFNFALLFFLGTVAAATTTRDVRANQLFILWFGLVIETLLVVKIYGTYLRLEYIVFYIRTDKTHPETIITDKMNSSKYKSGITYNFINFIINLPGLFAVFQVWIPILCVLTLFCYALFVQFHWLHRMPYVEITP